MQTHKGKKLKPQEVQPLLAEVWPHLFSRPVPLKVGIHRDLQSVPDKPVSHKNLWRFLYWWTNQPAYIEAVEKFAHRYDLQGNLCEKWPGGSFNGR